MVRISKAKFKLACKGSGGVGAVVAKAIGVTRGAVYHYLKKHPEMKQFLDEEGEQVLDVAEHNIDKAIVAGDLDHSWKALLNRKGGKARGYGPRQELEHFRAGEITFIENTKSFKEIKDGRKRDHSKSKTKGNP